MNKYVKIAMVSIIVLAVFLLAFFVTGKEQIEYITSEEYSEILEDGGFVYYGPSDDEEILTEIAKESDIKINILDSDKNKNNKLKKGTLYKYEDGKAVFKYSDDLSSYKLKTSLANEGLYKSYITVTLDEYKEIIKEDGYNFMFIGSEQCSYCTQFKESIKEALKDNSFTIYYIDISSITEDEYNELVKTDSYMEENEWGTPLSLLYKDGKRKAELNGYVSTEELVQFLKENKVI